MAVTWRCPAASYRSVTAAVQMTPLRLSPATGWLHARWLQAGYTPLVRVRGRVGVRVRVRVRVRLRLRLRLRLRVSRLRAGWLEAADGHACEPLGFVGACPGANV